MEGKRILIVEDEPQIAVTLCRALEYCLSRGHQVEISPLADEALTRLQHERFDLIITDLRMSGISGLELIRHVRQINPQTRTLLITGFGSPEVKKRAHQLAAVYLPKPFRLQEFIITVQRILGEEERELGEQQLRALNEEGLEATIGVP